jgi:hypothetical protein
MENARNTFYVTLRDRLATVNPERTMVLRGLTRPGILVEENELLATMQPPDVFVLRWTKLEVDNNLPLPLVQMECELLYATDGDADNAGMDRGRLLAEMDAELVAMIRPLAAQKMNYAVSPAQSMQTQVFWGDPVFALLQVADERLQRSATVQVYSYEEPGEL